MVEVFVGVGSNMKPVRHLHTALGALREHFGTLRCSPVYRNPAVGFSGNDFYNMVVAFSTALDISAVHRDLVDMETALGRDHCRPRFAPCCIDLDILLYGQTVRRVAGFTVPRPAILRYAFVLKPLADLAGELRHPVDKRRFAELWEAFDATDQPLYPVALGRVGI